MSEWKAEKRINKTQLESGISILSLEEVPMRFNWVVTRPDPPWVFGSLAAVCPDFESARVIADGMNRELIAQKHNSPTRRGYSK